MTLKEHLQERHVAIEAMAREWADVAKLLAPLLESCNQQIETYYYFTHYTPPQIHIKFPATPPEAAGEFVRAALALLGVQRASKAFDEETGLVTWKIRSPQVDFVIETGAVACKVRKVVEEVNVPARTEKRTRYEIEDPDECAALLRGAAQQLAAGNTKLLLDGGSD